MLFRSRWDTAEYRERMDPVLKRMRETSMATRVRVPDTAYYRKLRRVLGAETARELAASPVNLPVEENLGRGRPRIGPAQAAPSCQISGLAR